MNTAPAHTPDQLATDHINLAAISTWMRSDIDKLLRRLRNESPITWHEHPDSGRGFWAVVCHEDVLAMSQRPDLFSNRDGARINHDSDQGLVRLASGTMLEKDPPEHIGERKVVTKVFTPNAVQRLEPMIRARARSLIDAVAHRGSSEFVSEIISLFPLHVICDMMGVPEGEDRAMLFDLVDRSIGENDDRTGSGPRAGSDAAQELKRYGQRLAAEREASPEDDLMTALVRAEVDGERLTHRELGDFFSLLIAAGNETTRHSITHGLLGMTRFPDQRDLFLADPSLASQAGQEVVRYATPTMAMRRTVLQDTVYKGIQMREGEKVALWYISANRDERVFERPFDFDITREQMHSQAFGAGGPHFCLGAHLARLEIIVFFQELFATLPDIRPVGEPVKLRSHQFRGILELPVEYAPVAAGGASP